MPFIYKPLRQYMTPNDSTIDVAIQNAFDTIVNGQQCIGYRFLVYTMQNTLVENASNTTMQNTYKYYTVTVVNTASDTITVNTNELQNGDAIVFQTTDTLPAPLRVGTTYYIGNFSFGRFNVFESAGDVEEGTNFIDITDVGVGYQTIRHQSDIYNGETLTVYMPENTLEPGNSYKWQIELYANRFTGTVEQAYQVSVTATDISTGVLTAEDATGLAVGRSLTIDTPGEGVVLPEPLDDTSTYYIGSISGTTFKLYGTYDDALNEVDAYAFTAAQTSTFTAWAGGTLITANNNNLTTGDMIYVVNNNPGVTENSFTSYSIYYARKIDRDHIALFPYIEGARNDAGRVCTKSTSTVSLNLCNVAVSEQIPFDAYDAPTLTLESVTITQQSYTFKPTYYHPQGVMIQNFRALMRNGGAITRAAPVNPTSEEEQDSGLQENVRLEWTFDGLLSGNVYLVKFIVTTKTDQVIETDWVNFPVDYPTPDLGVAPEATNHPEIASVILEWAGIVQIVGDNHGEMEFVENFGVEGNWGLKMEPYAYLTFSNLDIRLGSSPPMFWWQPTNNEFSGVIMRTENSLTGDYIEVGYNGTNFYKVVNGITFNNAPMEIRTTNIYFIACTLGSLYTSSIYSPEMEGFITVTGDEFLLNNNDSLYVVKEVETEI